MTECALLLLFVLALGASGQGAATIHRLDGSAFEPAEAEKFAASTLAASHVTGAQIAVLKHGRPVWSYAYWLR